MSAQPYNPGKSFFNNLSYLFSVIRANTFREILPILVKACQFGQKKSHKRRKTYLNRRKARTDWPALFKSLYYFFRKGLSR